MKKQIKGLSLKFRIISIVTIFTLLPLFAALYIDFKSSTEQIMCNTKALNESINSSTNEKINSYINTIVKTMGLLPRSINLLDLEHGEQKRIIGKLLVSDDSINQVFLADSEGNIVCATDIFTEGTNILNESLFIDAYAGKHYISDSSFDKFSRIPIFLVSVPIMDIDESPVGVLGVQVSFSSIQDIIQNANVGETGYTYVIDRNGIVLAHHRVEEMVLKEYDTVANEIEGAVKVVNGEEDTSSYTNEKGKEVLGTYAKIPSTAWGVITEIELGEVMAPVEEENTKYIIITALSLLIALIASFFFANIIVGPIKKMTDIAKEFEGGVLTNRIKIKSKDEIGILQESFNAMADSLANILKKVSNAVTDINEHAGSLSDNSTTSAASLEEISAITQSTAEGSIAQIGSIQDTDIIAKELSDNVEKVSNDTKEAADTARNAAAIAQEGTDNINIINERMELIKNNVDNSRKMVRVLSEKSEEVTNIVTLIRNIAESTNMLALNAAIEAARAGEAGRGFAVVADEVRKLADQTKDASIDIENLLQEIQDETVKTVEVMDIGLSDVEQSTEEIKSAYGTFESIISQAENVASNVINVSNSIYSLRNHMERITLALSKVSEISYSTSEGTQSILASTEEQASALQEINESSKQLNEMAELLQEIVNEFEL